MNLQKIKSVILRLGPNRGSRLRPMIFWLGTVINQDICPSLNRYVYWLKQPVGWVVCSILFTALVGLLIGPQGFVLMWSLIAFLVVGAIWPWAGIKGIHCHMRFDASHTEERQETTARLVVTNRWPIPVFGLTVEGKFLQDIFSDEDNVVIGLQRIPAWSETEFRWSLKPERRGVLPSATPAIGTGFPFGIYYSQKQVSVEKQVVVWPKCENLSAIKEAVGANFNIDGALSDRPGNDGDVIGTRPYRQGDMIRHINWAKSARLNKLIVLERQTAAQKKIRVVVDLDPRKHNGTGSQSTFEWSIRIAASICRHLHLLQSHVNLQCIGIPSSVAHESTNHRGLRPMMDFLANLPTMESFTAQGGEDVELRSASRLPKMRSDEEIFWISVKGEGGQEQEERQNNANFHQILIAPPHKSPSTPDETSSTSTKNRWVFDTWQCPEEQIRTGWERLCSDA